jgi:hypothetical protein
MAQHFGSQQWWRNVRAEPIEGVAFGRERLRAHRISGHFDEG